jgi:hypothetical protein
MAESAQISDELILNVLGNEFFKIKKDKPNKNDGR